MYCKICGDYDKSIRLMGINICKQCFLELSEISVMDINYDRYKNLIRIILGYYINAKPQLNPVN